MNNNIHIAIITDNNYIMQTYIMLMSLYETKSLDTQYIIHILGYQLNNKNINLLKQLEYKQFEIEIINQQEIKIKDLSNKFISNYSPAIFLKMEIDNILKTCSKVLYLDSDIIIKQDLKNLYNIDITDKYLAAVKDIYPNIYHFKNNKKIYSNYFNVGMMLLNLDLIRKDRFFKNFQNEYITNGKNYYFPEQDAINNIIPNNKILLVSPIFNWITSNKLYTKRQLQLFYKKQNIQEKNIAIIHYAGLKPWLDDSVYYARHWNYYYEKSLFYDNNLKRKHKYNFITVLYLYIKNQIKIKRNKRLYKSVGII